MYSSSIMRIGLCAIMCVAIGIPSMVEAKDKNLQVLVEQARDLSLSGHYEDAIVAYKDAIKMKSEDPALLVELASLLRDNGDSEQAISVLKRVINGNESNAAVHLLYGELMENVDESTARKHYQKAIDRDPASQTAIDALSNLELLDGIVRDGVSAGSRADIAWSVKEDDGQIERFADQIEGEWCLELVDIYHHETGMCVSDPLAGDLAIIDGHPRIQILVDGGNRQLVSSELASVTELEIPATPIAGVEVAVGDHYEVHTVNFEGDRYLDFNVSNGASQCFQVQQFDRGSEQLNCSNAYTFCQCRVEAQ